MLEACGLFMNKRREQMGPATRPLWDFSGLRSSLQCTEYALGAIIMSLVPLRAQTITRFWKYLSFALGKVNVFLPNISPAYKNMFLPLFPPELWSKLGFEIWWIQVDKVVSGQNMPLQLMQQGGILCSQNHLKWIGLCQIEHLGIYYLNVLCV